MFLFAKGGIFIILRGGGAEEFVIKDYKKPNEEGLDRKGLSYLPFNESVPRPPEKFVPAVLPGADLLEK